MRKLGVFVVLFVFLLANQVLAAPDLTGRWQGEGVFASQFNIGDTQALQFFGSGNMTITIVDQQEAPGGAVFRGELIITPKDPPDPESFPPPPYDGPMLYVTGSISLTNAIHMTVSRIAPGNLPGGAIAVLSGQYLGRAINVVFQDLTDPVGQEPGLEPGLGLTGAFSLHPPPRVVGPDGDGAED